MGDMIIQNESNPKIPSQENGSKPDKKENAAVGSASTAVSHNKENLARVTAEASAQPNIHRALKPQPAPIKGLSIKLESYERIAQGDKPFEQEIYDLKELCRFAEMPTFESFKKLPIRSQYLIAACYQWDLAHSEKNIIARCLEHINWNLLSEVDMLEKFENLYKKDENLAKLDQGIQSAIRIREKILFLLAFQKAYVATETLNILDKAQDPKNIRELDPETYHELQAKADDTYQNSENKLNRHTIQEAAVSNGLTLLRKGYSLTLGVKISH